MNHSLLVPNESFGCISSFSNAFLAAIFVAAKFLFYYFLFFSFDIYSVLIILKSILHEMLEFRFLFHRIITESIE